MPSFVAFHGNNRRPSEFLTFARTVSKWFVSSLTKTGAMGFNAWFPKPAAKFHDIGSGDVLNLTLNKTLKKGLLKSPLSPMQSL